MIKIFANQHEDDWDEHLVEIEIAINNAVQDSTGYSPFYLNGGQDPRLPLSAAAEAVQGGDGKSAGRKESVSEWADRLRADLEEAKGLMAAAQEAQRRQANKHRRRVSYKPGDMVLYDTHDLPAYRSKLKQNYIGPFKVLRVLSAVSVELELPAALQINRTVHVEKLRLFKDEPARFPTRRQVNRQVAQIGRGKSKEWEVESIVAERANERAEREYLVLWVGYGLTDASWEPEENLAGAPVVMREWRRQQGAVRAELEREDGEDEQELRAVLREQQGSRAAAAAGIPPLPRSRVEGTVEEKEERKEERGVEEKEEEKEESEWSAGSNRQRRRSVRLRDRRR